MAAKRDLLSELHLKLTQVISEALDGDSYEIEDEETGEATVKKVPPSAAIMQVAAKFLKDNEVTCAPSDDNAMGELKKKREERDAKRQGRRALPMDLAAADEQMGFMKGLQ